MKKVILGLIAGFLLITLGSGTAYSHERDSRDGKVVIRTSPQISVNLSSLGIRVNFSRDGRSVWIPGHWERANYRRNYGWVPGHFEKRARYYPQADRNGYCRR
ncbi:MAG: hypothetical protein PHT53_06690 [Candidatus Omnitrophica bacterium]|nr:hypothetical protein [Candidatus Omnitrophota bacterium]